MAVDLPMAGGQTVGASGKSAKAGVVNVNMLLAVLVWNPELQSAMGEGALDEFFKQSDTFQIFESCDEGEQGRDQNAAGRNFSPVERVDRLIEKGLARQQGQRGIRARSTRDATATGAARGDGQALGETWLAYQPLAEGDHLSGVYRQRVDAAFRSLRRDR